MNLEEILKEYCINNVQMNFKSLLNTFVLENYELQEFFSQNISFDDEPLDVSKIIALRVIGEINKMVIILGKLENDVVEILGMSPPMDKDDYCYTISIVNDSVAKKYLLNK